MECVAPSLTTKAWEISVKRNNSKGYTEDDYRKIVGDLTGVEDITRSGRATVVEELRASVIRVHNVDGQSAGAVQPVHVLNPQDEFF